MTQLCKQVVVKNELELCRIFFYFEIKIYSVHNGQKSISHLKLNCSTNRLLIQLNVSIKLTF